MSPPVGCEIELRATVRRRIAHTIVVDYDQGEEVLGGETELDLIETGFEQPIRKFGFDEPSSLPGGRSRCHRHEARAGPAEPDLDIVLRHDLAAGAGDIGQIGDRPEVERESVLAVEHLIVDLDIEGDGRRHAAAGQHSSFDPRVAGRRLGVVHDRLIDRDNFRIQLRRFRHHARRHLPCPDCETAVDRHLVVGGVDVEGVVALRRVSDELDGAAGTEDPRAVDPTGDGCAAPGDGDLAAVHPGEVETAIEEGLVGDALDTRIGDRDMGLAAFIDENRFLRRFRVVCRNRVEFNLARPRFRRRRTSPGCGLGDALP